MGRRGTGRVCKGGAFVKGERGASQGRRGGGVVWEGVGVSGREGGLRRPDERYWNLIGMHAWGGDCLNCAQMHRLQDPAPGNVLQ